MVLNLGFFKRRFGKINYFFFQGQEVVTINSVCVWGGEVLLAVSGQRAAFWDLLLAL